MSKNGSVSLVDKNLATRGLSGQKYCQKWIQRPKKPYRRHQNEDIRITLISSRAVPKTTVQEQGLDPLEMKSVENYARNGLGTPKNHTVDTKLKTLGQF